MTAHEIGVALICLLLWCLAMSAAIEVAIAVANFWRKGGHDMARALNQAEYDRRDR